MSFYINHNLNSKKSNASNLYVRQLIDFFHAGDVCEKFNHHFKGEKQRQDERQLQGSG